MINYVTKSLGISPKYRESPECTNAVHQNGCKIRITMNFPVVKLRMKPAVFNFGHLYTFSSLVYRTFTYFFICCIFVDSLQLFLFKSPIVLVLIFSLYLSGLHS